MELQTAPHPPSSPTVDQLLQHADWLRNFARALVRDGHEAEDVAQETWIALEQAPVPEGLSGRRWLAGIAKNVVRNRRRSAGRRNAHEGLLADERAQTGNLSVGRSALDDTELLERQRVLLARIESLPEAQRRAIIARFYDGAMPAKIAETEGVPVSTIHSRIQRGLEKLRVDLDGEYGSRRAWAAFLAPLAGQSPEKLAATGAASAGGLLAWPVLVAAGALIAASLAWLALWGTGEANADEVDLARSDAATPAGPAPQPAHLPAELESPQDHPRETIPRLSTIPLSVVDGASATPVPQAEVIAMTEAEMLTVAQGLRETLSAFNEPSVPDFMATYGRAQLADDGGIVQIPADERVFAIASTDEALGIQVIEPGTDASTLELERAHRLTVRVMDETGAPASMPVLVGAILKTRRPKSAFESMPYFDSTERFTREGTVKFQNPWLGTTLDDVEPGPGSAYKYSIETVYIAVPGVGEYEPGARASGRFKPFSLLPGARERELQLPGTGSLDIELFEAGRPSDGEGTISVSFPGKTLGTPTPQSYEQPIHGGKARFPMFVTGGRPFEARISLPTRGSSWTVKGTGPVARAENKKWRVQVPSRAAVTARFVDTAGAPIAGAHVQLQHSLDVGGRPMGMTGFVAGVTDKNGHARFELPRDKKLAPPFTVKAARFHRGKLQETFAHLTLTEVEIDKGKDLGELKMEFVEATPIQGLVLDDDGRPFREAWVSIDAPGHFGTSLRTDAEGRFTADQCLFGGEVLKVSSNDGEFLDEFRALSRLDLSQPIEIQLSRGTTFKAQIDCGDIAAPEDMLGMRMKRTDRPKSEPEDRVWVKHLGHGEFVATAVPAGTYSVSLYLSGNVPLTTIEGVRAGPSGEARDPRVDGLRLGDYAREIQVTWEGSDVGKHHRPQMSVFAADPAGKRTWMHLTGDDEPYIVPTAIRASAVFETGGGRSYRVEDVQGIGDSLHIVFTGPMQAVIRIVGTAPSDTPNGVTWHLKGEPGTAAEGTSIRLKPSEVKARVCKVSFPSTGKYRLHRRAPDEDMGNNMYSAALPVPTTEVIEVEAPSGDEPPLFSLSISAPLARD